MSTVVGTEGPQTIYDDLSKHSAYTQTVSSDRTSWTKRKFPLVFVGVGLLLFILHSVLSCANKALGSLLFAFQWVDNTEPIIMRLGSFTRQRCEGERCTVSFLPSESFGGLPRTELCSYLSSDLWSS